jgi:hypothetical protein
MASGAPGCHNVERELLATAPPDTAPLDAGGRAGVERAPHTPLGPWNYIQWTAFLSRRAHEKAPPKRGSLHRNRSDDHGGTILVGRYAIPRSRG